MIRSERCGGIRHERALRRFHFSRDLQKLRIKRIAFNIELDSQHGGQLVNVSDSNVPLIGTRMDGDAMRAGGDTNFRGACHAGNADGSRISEQGDFV